MRNHHNGYKRRNHAGRDIATVTGMLAVGGLSIVLGIPVVKGVINAAQSFEYRDYDASAVVTSTVSNAAANVIRLSEDTTATVGDRQMFMSKGVGSKSEGYRTTFSVDEKTRRMVIGNSVHFTAADQRYAARTYDITYKLPKGHELLGKDEGEEVDSKDFAKALSDPKTKLESVDINSLIKDADGNGSTGVRRLEREKSGDFAVSNTAIDIEKTPGDFGYKSAVERFVFTTAEITEQTNTIANSI